MLGDDASVAKMGEEAHRRYAEIMRDVEIMIDDHSMSSFVYSVVSSSFTNSYSLLSPLEREN